MALTGVFPYPEGTTPEMLLGGEVGPQFDFIPDVLRPVFDRAAAFDPALRYDSAEEFAADLARSCGCPDVLLRPDAPISIEPADDAP